MMHEEKRLFIKEENCKIILLHDVVCIVVEATKQIIFVELKISPARSLLNISFPVIIYFR